MACDFTWSWASILVCSFLSTSKAHPRSSRKVKGMMLFPPFEVGNWLPQAFPLTSSDTVAVCMLDVMMSLVLVPSSD